MSEPYEYDGHRWEWTGNDAEDASHLHSVMNNTKWEELRHAMHALDAVIPWRCKALGRSYISDWDTDWFYHFRLGGYNDIEWTEIRFKHDAAEAVMTALARLSLPYESSEFGVKVFGYIDDTGRLKVDRP
ncbi:DUF6678 family protein [Asticcacaulis solisilvae]|uniref:DUF6678 family protein n=1 Tax=Asticcacaulis solisilvae TaxID=1217274 RepID=UPI003FD84639